MTAHASDVLAALVSPSKPARRVRRWSSRRARCRRWLLSSASAALMLAGSSASAAQPGLGLGARVEGPSPLANANTALLSADTSVARFALVVGSNETKSKEQRALRFADDDAARMAELWLELGAQVELLTVFDQSSQARFPALVKRAEQPTRAEFDAAWTRLRSKMEAAKDAGQEVELTIYYAGHGDVGPDGQGFLTLANGDTLTRADLFTQLLAASPADHNHLIVDACKSEQFVLSRGEWKDDAGPSDYGDSVREYLDGNHLGAHPDTGVILAHSADQQTHEWERWEGGIFTHELLSGLRGAADLNGDGAIEYSELGAFVSAANSGVGDPRARLEVAVRPPRGDERAPLVVHERVTEQRVLLFAGADRGRYSLEDARGIRLADINHASGQPAYLRLPEGDLYLYRHDAKDGSRTAEAKIIGEEDGVVSLARLEFGEPQSDARGPLDDALRAGLFKVAYGPGYYAGYTDNEALLSVADPDWEVHVWQRDPVTGELVEVAKVTGEGEAETETKELDSGELVVTEIEIDEDCDWCWDRTWLSLSVAAEFNVLNPSGRLDLPLDKFKANSLPGFDDQGFPAALRGVDVRMGAFPASRPSDYPNVEGYFRSGYTEGHATFNGALDDGGFADGQATSFDYLTVPLFFGGNIYFPDWPVRPYAGAGFGFDVLWTQYRRQNAETVTDLSLRVGFELHAGIDIRITNYFGLFGEVRQLWSAKRRVSSLPDYSNTGFTVVSGLKFGIPVGRGAAATNKREARARSKIRVVETRSPSEAAPSEPSVTNVVIPGAPGEPPVITTGSQAPLAPAAPAPAPAAAPGEAAPAPAPPGASVAPAPAAAAPTLPAAEAPAPAPAPPAGEKAAPSVEISPE